MYHYVSSSFRVLLVLVLISYSRASRVDWDVVYPRTATQDIDTQSRQSRDFGLPVQELYQRNSVVTVGESCTVDCSSKIYCHGEILHDIQMARIYPDSKTFVDKKLLYPEEVITAKYQALKKQNNGNLTTEQIKTFIDENFADDNLDAWVPPDFKQIPSIVNNIEDDAFRKWILNLNQIWKDLAQKVPEDVRINPDRHSYLYLPNGFIKAGGRFREMYYWDSYWVVRGLLLCDMFDTARGIVENMVFMVKLYGHVPNGNRKYYLQRSQPPLLIQMAATYHSCTKDHEFIQKNLQYFDTEFQFWYTNRMIDVKKNGRTHRMGHYNATSCTPRPESYYEDFLVAANVTDTAQLRKVFTGIKSAAESGWDFSSRHFRAQDGSNKGTLLDMEPQNLVYVDLNSILHANAIVLSEWYKFFGNDVRSQYYRDIANKLLLAIQEVFWDEEAGIWFDYDPILGQHRKYFFTSNLTPLWTGSYSKTSTSVEKVIVYLLTQGIIKFDFSPTYFGIPTSKVNTSQQWDFPNCWAPQQSIVIQGLERTRHPIARYIAFKMAQSWIHTTYTGFLQQGYMFEKYSAVELGTSGSGGEYVPQTGFGWTNSFCMELFNTWGKYLRSDDIQNL